MPMLWPSTLPIVNVVWQLENPSKGGGPALSGKELIVASGASRWTAKFDVVVGSRAETFCYRSIAALLEGRAGTILLSPCEPSYSPNVIAGNTFALVGTTHSDGSLFSDGTDYVQDGTYAYFVNGQATRDGAAVIHCAPPPSAGQYFGIDDAFDNHDLHLIDTMVSLGSNLYAVSFRPLLRNDYQAGQRLIFGRPTVEMRLGTDLAGELSLSKTDWAMPSLSFVEVF